MEEHKHHHNPIKTEDLTKRLNKIKGQLEGIVKMIDRDEHCVDLINQCRAVRGAILKVEEVILEAHLKSCVVEAFQEGNSTKVIEEILDIYKMNPNK
jgi:DNA-binding FrmR family transcriptional regulator